jgi:hypothetical protein
MKKLLLTFIFLLVFQSEAQAVILSLGNFTGNNDDIKGSYFVAADFEKSISAKDTALLGLSFTATSFKNKIPIEINGSNLSYDDYFLNSIMMVDLYIKKYFLKENSQDKDGNIYIKYGASAIKPTKTETYSKYYEEFLNDNGIFLDEHSTILTAKYSDCIVAAWGIEFNEDVTLEFATRTFVLNVDNYRAEGKTGSTVVFIEGDERFKRSVSTVGLMIGF